jgi:hypothetical protein
MPLRVYLPKSEESYVTKTLKRRTTGGCVDSGGSTTQSTDQVLTYYKDSYAVGWDTPGWRKIRNAGGLLPFSKWLKVASFGFSTEGERSWCPNPSATRYWYENFHAHLPELRALAGDADALVDMMGEPDLLYLVQKAAAAISSAGFDALTFLVELKQLRRMLSGVGEKLESLTRGKSPGQIHNLWLEGRYGWRTLRYDIDDFVEVLSETNDGRKRWRASKGLEYSGSTSSYSETTSSGIIGGHSSDYSWTVNARGTVIGDIAVPDFQFNPLVTAWEVTRLSFVLDWLLNVGQALEATTFLLLAKGHVSGGGFQADIDLERSSQLVGTTGDTVCHGFQAKANAFVTLVKRDPVDIGRLPHLKLRLDEWKVVDLLSLVLQRIV